MVKSLLKMKADPQLFSVEVQKNFNLPTHSNWPERWEHPPSRPSTWSYARSAPIKTARGRGLKTCDRCKRLRYCSVECQRAHWPTHKPECKMPAPKAVSKVEEKKEKRRARGAANCKCFAAALVTTRGVDLRVRCQLCFSLRAREHNELKLDRVVANIVTRINIIINELILQSGS